MAVGIITPSGYGVITDAGAGTKGALPAGGGANIVVTNIGQAVGILLLGSSSVTPPTSPAQGTAILPGQTLILAVGSNTYLAVTAMAGGAAIITITAGAVS
jgi:hypothetical protein